MIRSATNADFGKILKMCEVFWGYTCYDDAFDPEHVLKMIRLSSDHELLVVLQIEDEICGFVAGLALPLLGNGSVTQVTELAYWINADQRGHGLELLSGLETAARMRGAKYLNMISMASCEPEKADRIYDHRGYTKIETTWRKEL